VLGEEFKIGTKVHLLLRRPEGEPECAVGWITSWNDGAQTATAFGLRANSGGDFGESFALGYDLRHDDTGKEPPPAEDRLVASFHTAGMCPWRW